MPVEVIDRARQELDAEAAQVSAEVDDFFARLLPPTGDGREPLYEAMRHAAIGGGKRLRPLLTIAAARLFAIDRERALRVGCADIEMWAPPIIADQERAPVLEPAIEVHDRAALAVGARLDAIASLQDETAVCAHVASLHDQRWPSGG